MYTTFRQAFLYILHTKSKELCQLNFVYKMYKNVCRNVGYILCTNILYTKLCQNVGYILYTNILYTKVYRNVGYILYTNILYTFCIDFVY